MLADSCRCGLRDSKRSLLNRLFWRSGLASAYADMGAERLDKQVLLYRLVLICQMGDNATAGGLIAEALFSQSQVGQASAKAGLWAWQTSCRRGCSPSARAGDPGPGGAPCYAEL